MEDPALRTKTTFVLGITFWLLQFAVVVSHVILIAIWIDFPAAKSDVAVMPYIYTTILLTAAFLVFFLATELFFYLYSTLTMGRYHHLQFLKMRVYLIEMLALLFITYGVEDESGVVWKVIVATGCAGIPFNFSLGLAAFMARREDKSEDIEAKVAHEETPLLPGR